MGTSLRTGLSALSAGADAALIVLADQPFVRSATLGRVCGIRSQQSEGGRGSGMPARPGSDGRSVVTSPSRQFALWMPNQFHVPLRIATLRSEHMEGLLATKVNVRGVYLVALVLYGFLGS